VKKASKDALQLRARAIALSMLVGIVVLTHWPLFQSWGTFGAQDWDAMESERHLVVRSLFEFGQFPFWDPYAAGGVPAWGAPEGGTIAFSPILLVYWLLPLWAAIRAEVILLAVVGVSGMWRLAGLTTRDPWLRTFACVTGFLSTRWALQAAVGHAWHLYYGLFPWCVVLCHRLTFASVEKRNGALIGLALLMAFLVYCGGIYPLPHVVLACSLYALTASILQRTIAPACRLGVAGLLSLSLAAPKLLPIVDTMRRFPRLVPSRETVDPVTWLRLFTSGSSDRERWPVPELDYGYHEYGIYIGTLGVAVLLYGLYCVWRTTRSDAKAPEPENARTHRIALTTIGIFFMASSQLVGPWFLLHKLPVFASQHVPMRFMYPALMCLACVSAEGLESVPERASKFFPVGLLLMSLGIAFESHASLASMFTLALPAHQAPRAFAQTRRAQFRYGPPAGRTAINGPSTLVSRMENQGVLDTSTFDMGGARNADGSWIARAPLQGARGSDEPDYRGEVFTEGLGTATITAWSPNEVTVEIVGGDRDTRVMLNQNWDAGWTANGIASTPWVDLVSVLPGTQTRVVFRYRPRTFSLGCVLAGIALFSILAGLFLRKRKRSTLPS
jgi:hypothetical protein